MKIAELKVLKGPNYWSIKQHKLIQMLLNIEDFKLTTQEEFKLLHKKLQNLLPSIYEYEDQIITNNASTQINITLLLGDLLSCIAIELQRLAGIEVNFKKSITYGKKECYILYSYLDENSGIFAGQTALNLLNSAINNHSFNVPDYVQQLRKIWMAEKLGPSTASIVEEAQRRNIPYIRLDEGSLVQLGYGARQKRIEATITSQTSSIAVDIACNKEQTKKILTKAGIPVPNGYVINNVNKLCDTINAVGFPIVIKPFNGNHGKGATVNISNELDALNAFVHAKNFSEQIIVEKFIEGKDFRILMINNKFVAAAQRTPAYVIGDGEHTINELVEIENNNSNRGDNHDNILTRIDIDDEVEQLLQKSGYSLKTILPLNKTFYLKRTANLSTGGTATDVTDTVHPSNILLFERVAKLIGLDICGIDVIANDLLNPIVEFGGVVLEVNAAPGFRMHLSPSNGMGKNVAAPVIDMLFKGNGRIPLVAITGTNGKTTTTRLVAQMAQQAGYITGYTTTDGIYISNELIMKGDCSGPHSAQVILTDPTVEFAVLETARGGILRSGLGFDQCDAAIITNVAEDHLGLDGIDNLEKLANVKAVLAKSVSETGYAILNADDDLVYSMKDQLNCKIALFSLYSDNIRIEEHCNKGEIAAVYENGFLILRIGNNIIPIDEVKNVPLTFSGKAEFNIANVLGACLAAYTCKIKLSNIRQALRTFIPSSENTPGRINIFEFNDFTFILDYAHNQHGVRALGKFIKTFDVSIKIGIITGVGDRRDEDLIALGEEAARIFDEIIIRHDDDMRGRSVEEIESLISKGIFRVDPGKKVIYSLGENESVNFAIENARPQSLIVGLVDNIKKVTECIKKHQQERLSHLQKAV